ncbi:GntR family transcriptional regulator [Reyranella sp.]|uniref:GntR family transcriptional regulator n=1 Tax=Reyranella sp. TaxID=1929291 RepID=UPI003D0CB191
MAPKASDDTSLRSHVYDWLREALTAGRFTPGQKLSFRFIAGTVGVSLTPVREAIRRLVAEGAFEMRPNRSVRVPLMTRDRILELRDIRLALEGLAAEKAAAVATREQAARLRRIANELLAARSRGDTAADRAKIREFHFALYAIAGQPTLLRVIEGLWLQTGPYMNLLYPDFVASPRGPERRLRIIKAVAAHDAVAARRDIEGDIGDALSYVAALADEDGMIAPAQPVDAKRRRGRPSPSPASPLGFV